MVTSFIRSNQLTSCSEPRIELNALLSRTKNKCALVEMSGPFAIAFAGDLTKLKGVTYSDSKQLE